MPIRKSNDTLFYLFGTIPVIWLALLLAQSLGGGLPELLRNLTVALEQPANIIWTDKSLPTILICLAAYGMAVLLYAEDVLKQYGAEITPYGMVNRADFGPLHEPIPEQQQEQSQEPQMGM